MMVVPPNPLNAVAPPDQHGQLVNQTRKWVAQTFFGTMLKQMRDSAFKSDLFSGGQGGQAFGSLYDQHLAEHMTRGAGSKLVNSIVRRIEAASAYRKQSLEDAGRSDNRRTEERQQPHRSPKARRPTGNQPHAPAAQRS